MGRLCFLIKKDACADLGCKLDGAWVGQGMGGGSADERQSPVIAVVGNSHQNFFRRNYGNCVSDDCFH